MTGVGKSTRRIVVTCLGDAGLNLALEAMRLRVSLARELCDWDCAVCSGDFGHAICKHDVAGCGLKQMTRYLEQLGADLSRSDQRGPPGNHQRSAGEGAPTIGRAIGVAVHHLDHRR